MNRYKIKSDVNVLAGRKGVCLLLYELFFDWWHVLIPSRSATSSPVRPSESFSMMMINLLCSLTCSYLGFHFVIKFNLGILFYSVFCSVNEIELLVILNSIPK